MTAYASKSEELQVEKLARKALGHGNNVTALRTDIAAAKARLRRDGEAGGLEAATLSALADGRWPMDKAVPSPSYPHIDEKGKLIAHMENYQHMLKSYGISVGYDVIKKEPSWSGPGLILNTDNAFLGLFSTVKSLAALNGVPHGNSDLHAHLPAIADLDQKNPVRDYLSTLTWDGTDRIGLLVDEMGVHDTAIAEIALRIWFTGAVAACEHFETGLRLIQNARPSFEYVLALLGDQGVNKTKGFLGLVPKALSKYAKDGLSLKPTDKDSVKIAVSYWLAELGELDATFSQGAISDLKAFLSREADELRLAYAQGYSKFKRRTAFIGTVNKDKFLKDDTGNRRYLVLECANGFPSWSNEEVDQIWAQAWSRYGSGAQWWPTENEQKLLDANAENFRQQSWAEIKIRELFDFTRLPERNERANVSQIWETLKGGYSSGVQQEIQPKQLSDVGRAMKTLWLEHGALRFNGELHIKTKIHGAVKINADGGKNKGWLLPMTVDEVQRIEVRAKLEAEAESNGDKLLVPEVDKLAEDKVRKKRIKRKQPTRPRRGFPKIKVP